MLRQEEDRDGRRPLQGASDASIGSVVLAAPSPEETRRRRRRTRARRDDDGRLTCLLGVCRLAVV